MIIRSNSDLFRLVSVSGLVSTQITKTSTLPYGRFTCRLVSTQCPYMFSPNPSSSLRIDGQGTASADLVTCAELVQAASSREWTRLHGFVSIFYFTTIF